VSGLVVDIEKYFKSLNAFSATFIQQNNNELQEGYFYKNDQRIRIDYQNPSKILIIFDQRKAMIYNKDLEEVEYFNPKKTMGNLVFDIFYNSFIKKFKKHEIEENLARFYIDFKDDDEEYNIEVVFELNPLQIRLVNIITDEEVISFGLRDHNFNNSFDKKFFSMANPLLKN
tara:strand:+ start:1836 stop:2351 length:516 start_codon:yes stop_codon:yes gene_type:complete